MSTCPECLSGITEGASVCASCTRRIRGKTCPTCAEISKGAALRCWCCGHDFEKEERVRSLDAFTVVAASAPTLLFRLSFFPQEVHVGPQNLVLTTWGFLKMTRSDEDIPWEKVAGYNYHSGLFWDGISIETRGQTSASIAWLPKAAGQRLREVLELVKE